MFSRSVIITTLALLVVAAAQPVAALPLEDISLTGNTRTPLETVLRYLPKQNRVEFDLNNSSLDKELMEAFYDEQTVQVAELDLNTTEDLIIRAFIDRSVIEVFVNDRLCLTQRIYPTLTDSKHFKVYCKGGSITVREISSWKMHPAMPY